MHAGNLVKSKLPIIAVAIYRLRPLAKCVKDHACTFPLLTHFHQAVAFCVFQPLPQLVEKNVQPNNKM